MPAVALTAVPGRRVATIDLAKDLEARGFTGIYCPSFGDAMGLCQALATETSTIEFGTSIINIYARNAFDYAQSASFINELAEGRFRFGLGVSHDRTNKNLGLNTGKPLSDMRTFVETVRSFDRIGELPPIVLAGLRDKMCALAAEIAEGVTFANVARSYVPTTLERMGAADGFEVWNMIPTCISDDREAAAAVCRKTLVNYVQLPNYRNYWKSAGYDADMGAIEASIDGGNRDRDTLMGLMSDDWLSDCTLFGSADEVQSGLDDWFATGIRPVLVPSSTSGGQMVAFEELKAFFD